MELPLAGPTAPDPQAARPIGMVGIWRLTSLMYQGRWTDLYRAQPADAAGSPRSDYVVKMARQTSSHPAEGEMHVAAEVGAASAIRHPNVVAVLDASLTAAEPYCVMPRLEGSTLQDLLASRPVQALPVALWWARQCAQGLAALHAAGWVHRDVKPANLIISPRGHLTLIDLGFAALANSPCQGAFRGTADYAAPETLVSGAVIQPAADIYALGCVLNQITTADDSAASLPQPVSELIAVVTDARPARRPAAAELVDRLLRLELETLGQHICPARPTSSMAA